MLEQGVARSKASVFGKTKSNKEHQDESTLSNTNQIADELGCTSSCRMLEQGVARSKASVFSKMRSNKEHEDEMLVEQKKVSDNVSCDYI